LEVVVLGPADPRLKNLERFAAEHAEELDYLTEAGLQEWVAMLEEEDRR
jgi:hypothetical protein